jgi:hypothetical protein
MVFPRLDSPVIRAVISDYPDLSNLQQLDECKEQLVILNSAPTTDDDKNNSGACGSIVANSLDHSSKSGQNLDWALFSFSSPNDLVPDFDGFWTSPVGALAELSSCIGTEKESRSSRCLVATTIYSGLSGPIQGTLSYQGAFLITPGSKKFLSPYVFKPNNASMLIPFNPAHWSCCG